MVHVRHQIARYARSGVDARDLLVRLGFRILERPTPYHYVVEFPKGWTVDKRSDLVIEIRDADGFIQLLSYPAFNSEAAQLEFIHP